MKNKKLIDIIIEKFQLNEKDATAIIMSGNVLVNEIPVDKTGIKIDPESFIRIRDNKKYVSRGAYKLLSALDAFDVSPENKICADFGSSTGGFTEVLLERKAKKVYSVDSGTNQLSYKLRIDPKVVAMENTKINDLSENSFDEKVELSVMDISFTSALPAINHIFLNLKIDELIALIKPQFEFERLKDKIILTDFFNGIVKEKNDIDKIIFHIKSEITDLGLSIINIMPSSIKGQKGNQEYLFHIGI